MISSVSSCMNHDTWLCSQKIIRIQNSKKKKRMKKRKVSFQRIGLCCIQSAIHNSESVSSSHNPNALTTKAAAATITAANAGGTNKSIVDRLNSMAGKHSTSPGPPNGILTASSRSPHAREKPEDGEMAHTNAISGANDATATVTVSSAVHDAA